MKRKEVDDVLGGKDAWKNVDKSEGRLSRLIEERKRMFASFFFFKGENGDDNHPRKMEGIYDGEANANLSI